MFMKKFISLLLGLSMALSYSAVSFADISAPKLLSYSFGDSLSLNIMPDSEEVKVFDFEMLADNDVYVKNIVLSYRSSDFARDEIAKVKLYNSLGFLMDQEEMKPGDKKVVFYTEYALQKRKKENFYITVDLNGKENSGDRFMFYLDEVGGYSKDYAIGLIDKNSAVSPIHEIL